MSWLPHQVVDHLREISRAPDLTGTKYRLVRELARGGMGAVYLAEDPELNRQVALKVLHVVDPPGAGSGEVVRRMWREARIIARLEHPGIVPVHDVGELPDGRVFYVMKLVQGRRLDQYRQSASPRSDLLRVFQKACEAVAFAHSQGVIHRDLKPENIMVGSFGEVLVMDWGVAKVLSVAAPESWPAGQSPEACGTQYGAVLGTPAYMAPEQARGQTDQIDQRADVYALGGILHFLLTGDTPRSAAAGQARGGASPPRPLRAVCRKAMAQDPAERYPSAAELSADVARFLDSLPVGAYRENLLERAWRVLSRNRMAVILILAYLIMRLVLLFFSRR